MTRAETRSHSASGSQAEQAAATFLQARGYHVLERNFRCRGGEIDVIALDGGTLVFIEVKLRRTLQRGAPIEAVTALKQARIARAAQAYLAFCGRVFPRIRFDVISVMRTAARTEITHFKAAFPPAR
ncbi:MAG: YraN family protein [Candidatus Eremiobacteraeota bacterium]|nr:YraN family protein [Candidatus Eremiobacteraeota bacterium]MBV8281805.1 YraN family protein [Candidatus Eremiobacteraeota bacterium]